MTNKNLVLFAATSLIILSCKQNSQVSSTKSLDNFAAGGNGTFTLNSCSGSHAVTVSDSKLQGSTSDQAAVRTALSAVPQDLQSAFFNVLKGSIAIVRNLPEICRDSSVSSSQQASKDSLLACWKGTDSSINIYIKGEATEADTAKNIRHSVVRMMGYVLTDVMLKMKSTATGVEPAENTSLATLKKDVGEALQKDMDSSKNYRISKSILSDTAKYHDAAFAEGFDSWYCSTSTRTKMAKDFPRTHEIFNEISAALPDGLTGKLQYATAEAGALSSDQSIGSDSAFSLWGRWGRGNGPFRQAFSNWGSFRSNGGGFMNFRRWNNGGGLFFRR